MQCLPVHFLNVKHNIKPIRLSGNQETTQTERLYEN
uniref:Uncharacterized protein n=1 Tax=Anguilla anguilla TaxID=7936 RepID=A0A0E9UPB0_ANGAN